MNQMQRIEKRWLKAGAPEFEVGDTVRVHVKVIEGEGTDPGIRGLVIAKKAPATGNVFSPEGVLRVGVERIFRYLSVC
jgi:large subunit ribosomal protein L19